MRNPRNPYKIGLVQDKYAFPNALDFLDLGCKMGANHVEFKFEMDLDQKYNLRDKLASQIRLKAEKHQISLSVHAPYNDGVNLGDVDPSVCAETKKQMQACLQFAEKIGALYITVHGGFFETEHQPIVAETLGRADRVTVKECVAQEKYEALKDRTIEGLIWLVKEAKHYGVKVALENFHDFSTFKVRFPLTPEDFAECKARVGEDLFAIYDSGHGHSTGIHIVDFIRAIGIENILGTHLHDNNQLADDHLAISEGTVDFASFFATYRSEKWGFPLNVEAKNLTDLQKSFGILRQLNENSGKGLTDARTS